MGDTELGTVRDNIACGRSNRESSKNISESLFFSKYVIEFNNPISYMHNHLECVSVCIVQYLYLRYGNVDGDTYSLYSDQS